MQLKYDENTETNAIPTDAFFFYGHTRMRCSTVLSQSLNRSGPKKQEHCQAVRSAVTKTCKISFFVSSMDLLETFNFPQKHHRM